MGILNIEARKRFILPMPRKFMNLLTSGMVILLGENAKTYLFIGFNFIIASLGALSTCVNLTESKAHGILSGIRI